MATDYPKADISKRLIAFLIDVAVYVVIGLLLYFWLRLGDYLTGLVSGLYFVFRDGLFNGQSIGKKLMRLRVVLPETDAPADFQVSAKRNVILYIPILFRFAPFLGGLLELLVVAFELYFIFMDDRGNRWGDRFAETQVVEEA